MGGRERLVGFFVWDHPGQLNDKEVTVTEPIVETEEKKVEETKPEEKKVEETKPEEKSSLEQKREELLKEEEKSTEEKTAEEKKAKEEFEEEEVDWDALMEKFPRIAKMDVKDIEDVLSRYDGGLEQFDRDRAFVAELEKLGYDTRVKREEVLAKLKGKGDITPPAKPEPEKTFKDTRSERLAQLVPQQVRDPETGEARAITEEEKATEQKRLESFAESISPGDLPDKVDRVDMDNLNLQDDLSWLLFRLEPLLKKQDDLLSDDIRKQILDHSKQFPQTYAEIVLNAKKSGKNHYAAVYHHFITMTKQEQIDAEKKKNWKEEQLEEDKKKKAAKVETAKRAREPLEPQKTFAEKSVMAKRKAIVDAGG